MVTGRIMGAVLAAYCAVSAVQAQEGMIEVPRGLWQTEPDNFGVVLQVRTWSCGRDLCARVERAKNRGGYDTRSDAVGQKVFWSMRAQADGSFWGEYRDAKDEQFKQSRVEVSGRTLRLRACQKQRCERFVWRRAKSRG